MSQSKTNQNNLMKTQPQSEWGRLRSAADIESRIGALAASYTPEWHYTKDEPDIGAAIARVFANQMSENVSMYDEVIEKYHTEFVNMLDISLLPAKPSSAMVLFDLVSDTVAGVEVPRGTKLLAPVDDLDHPVVFETCNSIYVSNASLQTAFMTRGRDGRVMPLLGNYDAPELIPQKADAAAAEQPEEAVTAEDAHIRPFPIFGKMPDISKNALLFYHESVFDTEDNPLYVRFTGAEELVKKIAGGTYRFGFYAEQALCPFDTCELQKDGCTFALKRAAGAPKPDHVTIGGKEYHLLVLEALEPVTENLPAERVEFSSEGRKQPAQFVHNGTTDLDTAQFDPFGDTLALYQECYIGHDNYFAKAGARITLSFDVSYPEHTVELTRQQEQEELKIIKRKPRVIYHDVPADTYAEEISIEYFNGIGWKKLDCRQEYRQLFANAVKGRYELSFICPSDWMATATGAYDSRVLRIQLLKAENCYMRPCVHHYPHITELDISYCYNEHYVEPVHMQAVCSTKKTDCTRALKEHRGFVAFSVSGYSDDAVYLGFQNRMEAGPVSMLFDIADGTCYDGLRCSFSYSTGNGFRQMKVVDNTANFTRTGTVLFLPQSDMARMTLEGKQMYWIRITRSRVRREDEPEELLPRINDIRLNAVQVSNIETKEEQDFYLDEIVPNMSFALGTDRILDIDLWVNERDRYTAAEMQQMLAKQPERVRAEYDSRGEIRSFYVKWEELERLDDTDHTRGYVLDRMNNRLMFGDGVHMEVPRVTDDVAFRVRVRCCEGQLGNVTEGMINDVQSQFMFLNSVTNPYRAYGGSNMENLDAALVRGANILRSRRRLVSVSDYEREILSYSDTISQVRCITGRRIDGVSDPDAVTFVVLLKDYRSGSYNFHNLAEELKQHLLTACELTISAEHIHIVEPVFVDVCVDVWAKSMQMEDSFEIRAELTDCLTRYLDPVESENGTGWRIGVLPKKNQLLMKLNVLKSRAIVRKLLLIAKYTDESGSHEVELEQMKENPFMVCRSGVHHVHLMVDEK